MNTTIERLYRHRFQESTLPAKNRIWQTLCKSFFSRYVSRDATVLDLACGYGEFINNIEAAQKIAVDINSDAADLLNSDVRFVRSPATQITAVQDSSVDVVFCSNFLEHLDSKAVLLNVFAEVHRVLKPGGRFLIMGPNIRYVYDRYWDFFDHHLPLSDESLEEALVLADFTPVRIVKRFLPYTTRSALPKAPWLIALYLNVPFAWPLLGKQFFAVARK